MKKYLIFAAIAVFSTSTATAMNQNYWWQNILNADNGDAVKQHLDNDSLHEQLDPETIIELFRQAVMLEKINVLEALISTRQTRAIIACRQEFGKALIESCQKNLIQSAMCLLNNPHSKKLLVYQILRQAQDGHCDCGIRIMLNALVTLATQR